MKQLVAKGVFTWDGSERRSDRYGTFAIARSSYDETATAEATVDPAVKKLEGSRIKITIEVNEIRESGHIGDLFRGISPSTPEVGEVIELGEGELFIEGSDWPVGRMMFGLLPDDGRDADWLDPYKLYRLHDQTVSVFMEKS